MVYTVDHSEIEEPGTSPGGITAPTTAWVTATSQIHVVTTLVTKSSTPKALVEYR